MKVELSKREIEVILDLMEAGVTFLISHTWGDKPAKPNRQMVNLDELQKKLRSKLNENI